MSDRYAWDPAAGEGALAAFSAAPDGHATIEGTRLADGLMASMLKAEFLAAEAGVVPFIMIGGEKGIVNVGGARAIIEDPAQWRARPTGAGVADATRALYLGTHGAVRITHATSHTIRVSDAAAPVGVLPLIPLVALTVLGIAAIVAAADYASRRHEATVRVEGDKARAAASVTATTQLALAELQATGKISPGAWATFQQAAKTEAAQVGTVPLWPYALAAGAVVAGGIWWTLRDGRPVARRLPREAW